MRHTVEDLSPVKKKIVVTVPADEVNAALDRAVMQYRARVALPGFRKGKAPLPMVEKRFAQDIYSDAANEMINGNVAEILRELDLEPLSGIDFQGGDNPLLRGRDFSYTFSFEIMPAMDVPAYAGIGVQQEEVVVADDEIDQVIDRVRRSMATRAPVEEKRLPADNDVATMDFAGFDEQGEAVPGVSGEGFAVSLGENQVIPDFEALVRTVAPGDSGEGAVKFPDDYGNKDLAGKTVTMKITVKSLEQRVLPEVDDEFAKKAGGFESVALMRDNVRASYMRSRTDMAKAKAQSILLDGLLEKTHFPLPEGMVDRYAHNIMHERLEGLGRQGQDIEALSGAEQESLKAEAKTEAEKYAKTQLFLLTVAKKENLEVSGQEMTAALRQIAMRGGHDVKEVQEHYARNNLLPALRDRLLADKAMDAIYDAATGVTEKAAEGKEEAPDQAAAEKSSAGNESAAE